MTHEPDDIVTKKVKLFADVVNRVGFPVVACIALWWLCNTTIKANTESTNRIEETIKAGFGDMKDAIKEQNRILRRRGSDDVVSVTGHDAG